MNLEEGGNYSNWDDIMGLIENSKGETYENVRESMQKQEKLRKLADVFDGQPEVLLLDMIHRSESLGEDQDLSDLKPFSYTLGPITCTGTGYHKRCIAYWKRNGVIINNRLGENQELLAFLTYRHFKRNRSLNVSHDFIQSPDTTEKFDYTSSENALFMSEDFEETVELLKDNYRGSRIKFKAITIGFHDYIQITAPNGETERIEVGFDSRVKEFNFMRMDETTDIPSLAVLVEYSRNQLTTFIDKHSATSFKSQHEIAQVTRELIFNTMYGPNGVLNLTDEDEQGITREIERAKGDIELSVTGELYNKKTGQLDPNLTGKTGSKYQAEINMAVEALRNQGIGITKDAVIEFAIRLVREQKEDTLREKKFEAWYSNPETGQKKILFWGFNQDGVKNMQRILKISKNEQVARLQKEISVKQDAFETEATMMTLSLEAEFMDWHESNLGNPDHEYYLTPEEIENKKYYIIEEGPYAGKMIPNRISIQYASASMIMNIRLEKLKKKQDDINKQIFEIDDLDALTSLLGKSYSYGDWWAVTAGSSIGTTWNAVLGFVHTFNPAIQKMVIQNVGALDEMTQKISQESAVDKDDVWENGMTISGMVSFFTMGLGIGAEQAGNLTLMAATGGVPILSAVAVGVSSGGAYYYQNAAKYYSENGTLTGFDEDGAFERKAMGVGIANGASAYFMMRYMKNLKGAWNNSGFRQVFRQSLKETIKGSFSKNSAMLSGLLDQFSEVAASVAEGMITGEHLTDDQVLDVWFDTGVFNVTLGFLPFAKTTAYSFLSDYKKTDAIQKRMSEKDARQDKLDKYNSQKLAGVETNINESTAVWLEKEIKKADKWIDKEIQDLYYIASKMDQGAWRAVGSLIKAQEQLRVDYDNIKNNPDLDDSVRTKELEEIQKTFNELEQVRSSFIKNPNNISRWGLFKTNKDQLSTDIQNKVLDTVIEKYKSENNGKSPNEIELNELAAEEFPKYLVRQDFKSLPKNWGKGTVLVETIDDAVTLITDRFKEALAAVKGDAGKTKDLEKQRDDAIAGIKRGNHGVNFSLNGKRIALTVVNSAAKDGRIENKTHELGHTVFIEMLGLDPNSYTELADVIEEFLGKHFKDKDYLKGVETYDKKNSYWTKENDGKMVQDEVVMRFLELVGEGVIDLKGKQAKGLASFLTYFSSRAISKETGAEFGYRLDGEAGAINFLISLGKKIKDGTLTREEINMMKESEFINQYKNKRKAKALNTDNISKKSAAKVNEIYATETNEATRNFMIIEEYGGMINNIVNVYSNVPGFPGKRQQLIDEIKFAEEERHRDLYDLINEYDPLNPKNKGVPLAAWINKYLRVRAIEAAERVLDFEGVMVEYDENASYDLDGGGIDDINDSTDDIIETGDVRKLLDLDAESDFAKEVMAEVETILRDSDLDFTDKKNFRQGLEGRFTEAFRVKIKALVGKDKKSFSEFLLNNKELIVRLVAIKYKNKFDSLSIDTGFRETVPEGKSADSTSKNEKAGNKIWEIIQFTDPDATITQKDGTVVSTYMSEQEFLAMFTEGRKGWETARNSLINSISAELGLDAVSDAYKNIDPQNVENKLQYVADAVRRNPDIKFSNAAIDFAKDYGNDDGIFGQQESKLFREHCRDILQIFESNIYFNTLLDLDNFTLEGFDFPPTAVAWCYEYLYNPSENAVSQRYMDQISNNENFADHPNLLDFQNQGTFRYDEDAQDDQVNANTIVILEYLNADAFNATKGNGWGYYNRALNAAKTQENPKGPRKMPSVDGKVMKNIPGKNGGKNASHSGKTPLLVKNWEFDYDAKITVNGVTYTGAFVGVVNGKKVKSLDPVNDHDASLISAPHYASFRNINDNLNSDFDLDIEIDWDAISLMNVGERGSIMDRYNKIRRGSEEEFGKWGTEERLQNQLAAVREMLPEVLAANENNVKLAVSINEAWFNAMLDGKVKGTQYLRFLQLQSSDIYGPRALSVISGIHLSKTPPKIIGYDKKGNPKYEKTQGEHMVVTAETSAKAADLFARAFEVDDNGITIGYKDGYDKQSVRDELFKIFNANNQIPMDHSLNKQMDAGPGKETSSGGNLRINFIDEDYQDEFYDINARPLQEGMLENSFVELNDEITRDYQIKNSVRKNTRKAIDNISEKQLGNVPIQGASVFDFDETVGISDNYVIATRYNKDTGLTEETRISSADWPTMGEKMISEGWAMDFSDFNKVTEGQPGPLLPKLKNQIEKYGVDNTYILTARAAESAQAIQAWLKSEGIDLPIENIIGLGDSTGKAKADWIEQTLIWNGFNDIYFVDDAASNVDAVDDMFSKYPDGLITDGGKSVLVRPEHRETHIKFSEKTTNETFNIFIEETSGIDKDQIYSRVEARTRGAEQDAKFGRFNTIVPYSAEDFKGLLYQFLGEGDMGEYQMAWFNEKLIKPYSRGESELKTESIRITGEYSSLVKSMPGISEKLRTTIGGESRNFSIDDAVRVYLWNKKLGLGADKIGIPPKDLELLVNAIESDAMLRSFSNQLNVILDKDGNYIGPGNYWETGSIAQDVQRYAMTTARENALSEFLKNADEVFSEENLNKIEAIHGTKYRIALDNMLARMRTGKRDGGKDFDKDPIVSAWDEWVNNSVGAIMFLNGRSAVLQTLSTFNYVKLTGPNNAANAANAFANQEQFWLDFKELWNSDYLVSRRDGEERGINEAELAAAVKKGGARGAIAYLLKLGFTPTRLADSFAIASGGATFVRNYTNAIFDELSDFKDYKDLDLQDLADASDIYDKSDLEFHLKGRDLNSLSETELQQLAKDIALDFWETETETGQQSSRQDMMSMEQTGGLGRLILAFKNTPMQYTRKIMRAAQDIKNGRGNPAEHAANIAYYGGLQSLMFNGLQSALFAKLDMDDEEWEEETDEQIQKMVEGYISGMGLKGVVTVTIKNGVMEFLEQEKKGWNADHTYTILEFANVSPTIGSKLRKLYSSIKTKQLHEDTMDYMSEWDPQNPAWSAVANLIEAFTNIPTGDIVQKMNNLLAISADENEWWQNLSLLLGWNTWDVNVKSKAQKLRDTLKENKQEEKIKLKQEKAQEEINKDVVEEVKENEDINQCVAARANGTRCKNSADKPGGKCASHMNEEELGKATKCSYIKPSGEQCKMISVTDAGRCNTKQHQPGYKKK